MTSLRELAFPSAEQMPARPGHRGRKFDIKTELSPQQAGKIREDTGAVPSGPVKGCASMNTSADCARHPPRPGSRPSRLPARCHCGPCLSRSPGTMHRHLHPLFPLVRVHKHAGFSCTGLVHWPLHLQHCQSFLSVKLLGKIIYTFSL